MMGRLKKYIKKKIKKIDYLVYNLPTIHKQRFDYLLNNLINNGIYKSINFNYEQLKKDTLDYIKTLKINNKIYSYKFSQSQKKENIYSSVYALLILDMYDEVKNLTTKEKQAWINYFDSFQNKEDGLWYDKNIANEYYNDSDWWGARHLAIHIIAAYTALDAKPKYNISYVEKYYDLDYIKQWLDKTDWNSYINHENDIDNKIMNIGVIFQYQRDFYGNKKAKNAIEFLYGYLDEKINKDTSMWGKCNINNPYKLSRTVQFAYHILMLYLYDKKDIHNKEKIVELTLKTQNRLGGFGVELNSSACEDIDSVELLINLSNEVDNDIKKSFAWILSNQMDDGGFVFQQNTHMWYGHETMTADMNESHLFATWFRTLSLAKIVNKLNKKQIYKINKTPAF